MSVGYVAVQWSPRKILYDFIVAVSAMLFVWLYRHFAAGHGLSTQVIAIRSYGTCAFGMMTIILSIGPLARLDARFLPWLYNRRHFGVMMAACGVLHAREVLSFHLAYGRPSPVASLFVYDTSFSSGGPPVTLMGLFGLLIVLVMAVTSHDFWQRFMGPIAWKWLHMSVYLAYACLVLHVLFGALVAENASTPILLAVLSVGLVTSLHLLAAAKARRGDALRTEAVKDDEGEWLDAGPLEALPLDRATALCPPQGEKIALVRHKDGVSAMQGVCAHQGGPLTEGRVIDGCLTCPWHGWQYQTSDGRSPPPFQEALKTYRVRLKDGRVLVDPRPIAPRSPDAKPVETRPVDPQEKAT